MSASGQLWTWGNNGSGQLGNGNKTNAPEPIRIQSINSQVVAVAGGRYFSMALLSDGTLD